MELNPDQFTVAPRLKNKPNSQGTLFQGGKPTDEHRWPRGYTPQRMREVQGATGGKFGIAMTPDSVQDVEDSGHYHPFFNQHSMMHTVRLVQEPLARSSVPAEHLGSLEHIRLNMSMHFSPTERAHYIPEDRRIQLNPVMGSHEGSITPVKRPWMKSPEYEYKDPPAAQAQAEMSLMHEVGHHIDMTQPGRLDHLMKLADQNSLPAGFRGEAESEADWQMLTHFRPDPRGARATRTGIDPHRETYGQRGAAQGIEGGGYVDPSRHAVSRRAHLRGTLQERADQPMQERLF